MRKLLLFALAFAWGYLVYGLHHSIGYEKGSGYPSMASSLGWAFLAALPLLIGPFVIDHKDESQKFNRWCCVAWLAAQAAFLIILSWLKIFGLIPLLGIGLILWPQDEQQEQAESKQQVKNYTNYKITALLIAGLLYWWHYNPLPSDEEMIAHFHNHRAEIEELVKRYQEREPSVVANWHALPENVAMMKKSGVKNVASRGIWHPNPYSKEAAREFWDKRSAMIREKKLSTNSYASIAIELVDESQPERHFARVLTSSGPRWIFKELVFISEIARIEGENLWFPAHVFFGVIEKKRIFSTLDEYPSHWIKGECVYRQFEAHWFIAMCAAAV